MARFNFSPSGRWSIHDSRVLAALEKVPRHEFVSPEMVPHAYADRALPIGEGQTISQPFIVGFMTQELSLGPGDRVLEIGTGSGYQAAILAELAGEVYSVEIRESLAARAEKTLKRLGYGRVHIHVGDGYRGWREESPYDAIIATCAAPMIPPALVEQLKIGGRMILPLGKKLEEETAGNQELIIVRKTLHGVTRENRMPVRFVPMI